MKGASHMPGPAEGSPGLAIRPVTAADTRTVVALWLEVFPEYLDPSSPQRDPTESVARKLALGDGLFWLAELCGVVVGTAMAGWDGHRGWLYSVGVHPSARRRGVARALLATAEAALRALGCPKVNLQARKEDLKAQTFWRHAGYRQDAVVCFGRRL